MPLFEQTFLQPGTYRVGPGRYRRFSAADLREYMDGTLRAMRAGITVPIFSEHPLPGSDEGAPRQFSQSVQFADAIREVGELRDLKQKPDGSVVQICEIKSPEHAKAIRNNCVRWTSPEMRESYEDGKGRKFGRIFAHFALTPNPRNPDQTPLKQVAGATQFSLDDLIPIQFEDGDATADLNSPAVVRALLRELGVYVPDSFEPQVEDIDALIDTLRQLEAVRKDAAEHEKKEQAVAADVTISVPASQPFTDDDEEKPDKNPIAGEPKAAENPDAPADAQGDQKQAAIVALLSELGVELPADFTMADDINSLLAALKTAVKAKQDVKADEATEEGKQQEPILEEKPMASQFSAETKADLDRLTKQVTQLSLERNERSRKDIKDAIARCPLPAMRDKLAERLGAVQFADDGNEEPLFKLSEVVDMVRTSLPASLQFALGDAEEESHPDGDDHYADHGEKRSGTHVSRERAKEIVDDMEAETGYGRAPRDHVWNNPDPMQGPTVKKAETATA